MDKMVKAIERNVAEIIMEVGKRLYQNNIEKILGSKRERTQQQKNI